MPPQDQFEMPGIPALPTIAPADTFSGSGAAGGIAQGMARAAMRSQKEELEREMQARELYAKQLFAMSNDPQYQYQPEVQQRAMQMAFQLMSMDPRKKRPKELQDESLQQFMGAAQVERDKQIPPEAQRFQEQMAQQPTGPTDFSEAWQGFGASPDASLVPPPTDTGDPSGDLLFGGDTGPASAGATGMDMGERATPTVGQVAPTPFMPEAPASMMPQGPAPVAPPPMVDPSDVKDHFVKLTPQELAAEEMRNRVQHLEQLMPQAAQLANQLAAIRPDAPKDVLIRDAFKMLGEDLNEWEGPGSGKGVSSSLAYNKAGIIVEADGTYRDASVVFDKNARRWIDTNTGQPIPEGSSFVQGSWQDTGDAKRFVTPAGKEYTTLGKSRISARSVRKFDETTGEFYYEVEPVLYSDSTGPTPGSGTGGGSIAPSTAPVPPPPSDMELADSGDETPAEAPTTPTPSTPGTPSPVKPEVVKFGPRDRGNVDPVVAREMFSNDAIGEDAFQVATGETTLEQIYSRNLKRGNLVYDQLRENNIAVLNKDQRDRLGLMERVENIANMFEQYMWAARGYDYVPGPEGERVTIPKHIADLTDYGAATELESKVLSRAGDIARSIRQEKGNMAEGDVARSLEELVKEYSSWSPRRYIRNWFKGDTPAARLADLRNAMSDVSNSIFNGERAIYDRDGNKLSQPEKYEDEGGQFKMINGRKMVKHPSGYWTPAE